MQIIDLTKPGDNYKVITFPDGEKHLEIAPLNRKESVAIICRITNGDELYLLMQLADILKRQCVEVACLRILYLMGMRCDRLFDLNRPFTLGLVADVVNSLGARNVELCEPHSLRSIRMINNASVESLTYYNAQKLSKDNPNMRFVAPDNGATLRYVLPYAVVCSKVRDEATGQLLSFKAEEIVPVKGCDLIVVDDLCDGGGTFVGLAPKLREFNPKSLSLLVTHAIQKQGIEKVAAVYDKVYITETYKNWSDEQLPENVEVM